MLFRPALFATQLKKKDEPEKFDKFRSVFNCILFKSYSVYDIKKKKYYLKYFVFKYCFYPALFATRFPFNFRIFQFQRLVQFLKRTRLPLFSRPSNICYEQLCAYCVHPVRTRVVKVTISIPRCDSGPRDSVCHVITSL